VQRVVFTETHLLLKRTTKLREEITRVFQVKLPFHAFDFDCIFSNSPVTWTNLFFFESHVIDYTRKQGSLVHQEMECFLHLNAIQGVLAPSPSHVSSYSKVYCPSHSSHSIWSLAPRVRAEIERILPSHLGELIAALSSSSGDIKASAHRIAYPQAANSSCNVTNLAILLADEDMIRRDLLSCRWRFIGPWPSKPYLQPSRLLSHTPQTYRFTQGTIL
jgi:hypothetical protein